MIGPPVSVSGEGGKKDGRIGWEGYGVFCGNQGHTTAGGGLLLFIVYGLGVLAERRKRLLTWIASNQKYR